MTEREKWKACKSEKDSKMEPTDAPVGDWIPSWNDEILLIVTGSPGPEISLAAQKGSPIFSSCSLLVCISVIQFTLFALKINVIAPQIVKIREIYRYESNSMKILGKRQIMIFASKLNKEKSMAFSKLLTL